jgi:hypothetical protein
MERIAEIQRAVGAAGFWRDESSIMRTREEEDARWSRFRASGPSGASRGP